MSYVMEICKAGKTIEVNKYYTYTNHPKGQKRAPKGKDTCDAQLRVNHRKAIKDMRRLLNNNFVDGDYLVRLDFYKYIKTNGMIDSECMQSLVEKFWNKMRRRFKKQEKKLKYLYVKEIGKRGGRHVHIVMSKCDLNILSECWNHGGIHVDPLNTNGQYAKIAEYFAKYADRTIQTEGQLVGKRWYGSRTLEKPKVTKKVITAKMFRTSIQEKKGYYVDKNSIKEGISGYTGYPYVSYTYVTNGKMEKSERQDKDG